MPSMVSDCIKGNDWAAIRATADEQTSDRGLAMSAVTTRRISTILSLLYHNRHYKILTDICKCTHSLRLDTLHHFSKHRADIHLYLGISKLIYLSDRTETA